MKFAKFRRTHLEETLPEWRDKFLSYKLLRKLLKGLPPTAPAITAVDSLPCHLEFQPANANPAVADGGGEFHPLGGLFVPILNEELKKLNYFYVDKEEEFVIRFQELKGRIESVGEWSSSGGAFTSETFRKEVMDIRKDFVTIHGEMVLLKKHSWWNFRAVSSGSIALVKILKKYDKRTGGVLHLRFTQLDHQPLFTTETLTRLVRECETTLELLFPLEAEVTEDRSHSDPQSNDSANIASETPSNMEANMDIYRGTVAAMKAIQGLQKPSSTSGPGSLSNHFRSQDEESTGAVTVENSTSNSVASWQSEEEDDQL